MICLKSVYTILLTIYILMSMLVPLAGYNKMMFVLLVVIYGGYLLFFKKEKKFECLKLTMVPIWIILIFVYGFIRGMFNDAVMDLAQQFLLVTSLFALIYPVHEFEIDMNRVLKIVAKLYILFFGIYVVYAMNVKEFAVPAVINKVVHSLDNGVTRFIGQTLQELGSGLIKHRSFFGGKGMQIYLGSTPFLLVLTDILFIDLLRNKKTVNLVYLGLALLLTFTTGSRTLMLLVPASFGILIWLGLERKKQVIAAIILAIAGMGALIYLLNFSNFFSLEERSNFVKVGHMISYFQQLELKNALLGEGLATIYYSAGTEYELAHTEITLMDHFRYFGIPLGISIWIMMFVPKIQKNFRDWKNWKIWQIKEEAVVVLLYFVFAQTNPVLFNSYGLILVLWYWAILFALNKKENNV